MWSRGWVGSDLGPGPACEDGTPTRADPQGDRGRRASWRDWATSAPVASQTSPSSSMNPPVTKRVVKAQRSQPGAGLARTRSEEHTSELQSLMRISYAVFCLKKKKNTLCTEQYLHAQNKYLVKHQ